MTFIRFDTMALQVDDLLQGEVQLASPPEIYVRLRRLVEDPDSTTAMMARAIEHDPALAARVLRLANSAFFSMPQQVVSILDAVNRIGVRELQDLVLATEVIQRFESLPAELVDIYAFWRQGFRCAALARELTRWRRQPINSESIFIAALLHGIGQLVIYARVPELARQALLEQRHRGLPQHKAERAVMGFDYAQVGAALARSWQLPPLLPAVMAYHVEPHLADAYQTECALVHVAHAASQAQSLTQAQVEPLLPDDPTVWELANLDRETLCQCLPEAERTYLAALALMI